MGFKKGQRKMKMRNKLISVVSAAAVLAVVTAVSLGVSRDPKPDVLSHPPVTIEAIIEEDIIVYTTSAGNFYHVDAHCSGMENAEEMTEREAVALGKQLCPVCIPLTCPGHDREEIEFVYYSQGGPYLHKDPYCGGGQQPLKGDYFTLSEEYPGKQSCTDCLPGGVEECLHGRVFVVEPEPSPTSTAKTTSSTAPKTPASQVEEAKDEQYHPVAFPSVYYTANGRYYHSDQNCIGMMNAQAHTRSEAEESDKLGCPWCLQVYCTEGGVYFHIYPDCSGMQNAGIMNIQEAAGMGKKRCGACMYPATVYASSGGSYCHVDEQCSGMKNAQAMTLDDALMKAEKLLCPACMPHP